jgi:hypothetical protein
MALGVFLLPLLHYCCSLLHVSFGTPYPDGYGINCEYYTPALWAFSDTMS